MPTKKKLQKELDELYDQYAIKFDRLKSLEREHYRLYKNYERLKEKYEELGKREWMNRCAIDAINKWIEEEHNAGNPAFKDVCFSDFIPYLIMEPDAFKYKEEFPSDEEEEEA